MIGNINQEIVDALLEALPIGFTLIDADDHILGWNQHETRTFKRPMEAIGQDMRGCHPPKSHPLIDTILREMKAGKRDVARFWFDTTESTTGTCHKILVEYLALRDKNGNYLGCAGTSQDITDIQKLTGQSRVLD
jgi:PAS domain S-box-containing protein